MKRQSLRRRAALCALAAVVVAAESILVFTTHNPAIAALMAVMACVIGVRSLVYFRRASATAKH